MSDKEKDNAVVDVPPTAIEWGMRAFSLAAMLVLFGFLTYATMLPAVGPNFALEVHSDKIEERRNGWAVPFTMTNKGTVAIADVLYEMRLRRPGSTEAKQGRIAIFGAGESIKGEVWFENDPRGSDLELRVDTYSL